MHRSTCCIFQRNSNLLLYHCDEWFYIYISIIFSPGGGDRVIDEETISEY